MLVSKRTVLNRILPLSFVSTLLFSSLSIAGNIDAGKAKATKCFNCHGEDGISHNEPWPNLAGQKKTYLIKQLTDFKAGRRVDPVMNNFAKILSEEDIQDIAAYFSSLK